MIIIIENGANRLHGLSRYIQTQSAVPNQFSPRQSNPMLKSGLLQAYASALEQAQEGGEPEPPSA